MSSMRGPDPNYLGPLFEVIYYHAVSSKGPLEERVTLENTSEECR